MKEYEYQSPEFKLIKTNAQDVLTTSGTTPPWGGEVVTNPDFPEIGL